MEIAMKNKDSKAVKKSIFHVILTFLLLGQYTQAVVYHIPIKRSATSTLNRYSVSGQRLHKRSADRNLNGHAGEGYYVQLNIGTPPQKINVLVDTGSSNLAVAASPSPELKTYFHRNESSTYKEDGREVHVPYTQGEWDGVLGQDKVTLDFLPNVTIHPNIAFITKSSNFYINGSEWQGIVGFGYKKIARPDSSLVPFFDSLIEEGHVNNIFSIQLCGRPSVPLNGGDDTMGGTLTIGGISSNLYKGDIHYTPIFKEWYYEVVLTDIEVDGQSLSMDCKEYNFDKTIVDSGTTNVRFPKKVFNAIIDQMSKSPKLKNEANPAFWNGVDQLCWNESNIPFDAFPVISISFYKTKNSTFKLHLSPQKYLRLVTDPLEPLDLLFNPFPPKKCFKFGITSSETGTVLGAVLMEGYYVIFDRENKQIGFASTTCPATYHSASQHSIQGPIQVSKNISDCYYVKSVNDQTSLMVVAYVMAGVCCLCLLPLIVMIVQWQYRRSCGTKNSDYDSGNLITH